jgi:hypothetical protein
LRCHKQPDFPSKTCNPPLQAAEDRAQQEAAAAAAAAAAKEAAARAAIAAASASAAAVAGGGGDAAAANRVPDAAMDEERRKRLRQVCARVGSGQGWICGCSTCGLVKQRFLKCFDEDSSCCITIRRQGG